MKYTVEVRDGVEFIQGEGQKYKIATPARGFLSEADKELAARIGLIPGIYADGTVVQRDGTIVRPPVAQTAA